MSLLLQFRGPTLLFLLVKVQAADRHPEKAGWCLAASLGEWSCS